MSDDTPRSEVEESNVEEPETPGVAGTEESRAEVETEAGVEAGS